MVSTVLIYEWARGVNFNYIACTRKQNCIDILAEFNYGFPCSNTNEYQIDLCTLSGLFRDFLSMNLVVFNLTISIHLIFKLENRWQYSHQSFYFNWNNNFDRIGKKGIYCDHWTPKVQRNFMKYSKNLKKEKQAGKNGSFWVFDKMHRWGRKKTL